MDENLNGIAAKIKAHQEAQAQQQSQQSQQQNSGQQQADQTQGQQPTVFEQQQQQQQQGTTQTNEAGATGAAAAPVAEAEGQQADDFENEWYNQPDPTTAQASAPPAQQTDKQQQPPADPLYARYAEAIKDPAIQMILDAKLAGKAPAEIMEEFRTQDYSKISDADIFRTDLEANGITGEALTEALEDFEAEKSWKKTTMANEIRAKFNTRQQQRLQQFQVHAQQTQAQRQEFETKFKQEVNTHAQTLVGKNFHNIVLTEDLIAAASDRLYKGYPELTNPDGSPNVAKSLEYALILNNHGLITKKNVEKARAAGQFTVANEVHNASKNMQGQGVNMGQTTDATSAVKNYVGKQREKFN